MSVGAINTYRFAVKQMFFLYMHDKALLIMFTFACMRCVTSAAACLVSSYLPSSPKFYFALDCSLSVMGIFVRWLV